MISPARCDSSAFSLIQTAIGTGRELNIGKCIFLRGKAKYASRGAGRFVKARPELPGDFKAKRLKLLDIVAETRQPLIITKHGKAVAKLMPIAPEADLFGA